MDQLKNILRQVVKQRFWIAVAVAAILPLGLYFGLSGSLNADTDKKAADINSALKGAQGFVSGEIPNAQHTGIVADKTGVLKSEVDKTWTTLYDRQAPLMTWPETVQDRFPAWGRAWPKGVDSNLVQESIIEYVNAFPDQVDKVYSIFHPYNFREGTGIVTAPAKEELLMAPEFDFRVQPTLKQIWDSQQRLWLQAALLDVVAKVNEGATDWDSATIKQVTLLDVASVTAQDQASATAKDNKLAKSAEIVAEGTPPAVDPTKGANAGSAPGGMGGMGGMGGGNKPGANQDLYSVEAPGGQYRLYPVALGVLIDQSKIQELLAALKTSPMVIQVKEIDVQRPTGRVVKPSKNAKYEFANQAGLDSRRGGFGQAIFNPTMSGYGPGYRPGMAPGGSSGMQMPAYGTMASMGYGNTPVKEVRKGVSVRDRLAAAKAKKAEEVAKAEADAATKVEPPNPYYDIVQVTVYGQARFYSKPPEPPASTSESAAKAEDPKAKAEASSRPKAEVPKAEPSRAAEKAEPNDKAAEKPEAEPNDKAEEKGEVAPKAVEEKAMEKEKAEGTGKTKPAPDADPAMDEADEAKPEAPAAPAPKAKPAPKAAAPSRK